MNEIDQMRAALLAYQRCKTKEDWRGALEALDRLIEVCPFEEFIFLLRDARKELRSRCSGVLGNLWQFLFGTGKGKSPNLLNAAAFQKDRQK